MKTQGHVIRTNPTQAADAQPASATGGSPS